MAWLFIISFYKFATGHHWHIAIQNDQAVLVTHNFLQGFTTITSNNNLITLDDQYYLDAFPRGNVIINDENRKHVLRFISLYWVYSH